MVNFEINGKKYSAPIGTMIIQVADQEKIPIPRFCYHNKLSIAANCRMCLVEVEKSPKPLPACATPVVEGMKVWTHSPQAVDAQKSVMEFLLINHPLDCPICDQGGECELQDLSWGYGKDVSRFTEGKRSVKDLNIGSLIKTEMTRCIHCTRCVRFGMEIAGMRELGATGRGEHLEIGTFLERSVDSELSGCVIDVCPVGALTSKTFRHTARPWELKQVPSIAPHDCVGSHVYVHALRGEVKRVVPRLAEEINEAWISDRDRFGYCGLKSSDRVLHPLIRKNGTWIETDWKTAFQFTVEGLKKIIQQTGAESIGVLVSPSATLEECYLLQKWLRGMGVQSIDHRLRQIDFSFQEFAPLSPTLGFSLSELETCDVILLIGTNSRKEQPLFNHRVRKAALQGSKIIMVNVVHYDFNFRVAAELVAERGQLLSPLLGITKALGDLKSKAPNELAKVVPTAEQKKVAEYLAKGQKVAVILGNQALAHWHGGFIELCVETIAELCQTKVGRLTDGANSAGAWLSGVVPHRGPVGEKLPKGAGLDALAMLKEPLKAYVLWGVEPDLDCAGASFFKALAGSSFLVSFSAFRGGLIDHSAQVILPIAAHTETGGTFVNVEGRWQSFDAVVNPPGEARPGWKILRVLGEQCGLEGFQHSSSEEVRDELKERRALAGANPGTHPEFAKISNVLDELNAQKGLYYVTDWPIYRVDSLVRRAEPLQNTKDNPALVAKMNQKTASVYAVREGEKVRIQREGGLAFVELPLTLDERIPDGTVYVASGMADDIHLGLQGAVQLLSSGGVEDHA